MYPYYCARVIPCSAFLRVELPDNIGYVLGVSFRTKYVEARKDGATAFAGECVDGSAVSAAICWLGDTLLPQGYRFEA